MKFRIWQAVGLASVAPTVYGFLAWLSWWTPQVSR